MRRWLRPAGYALIAVGVVALGLGVTTIVGSDDSSDGQASPIAVALRSAGPAAAPFRDLTVTPIGVGGHVLRVVIADSATERSVGLRARRTIGRYDGMLFVFDADTTGAFTMSTVPVALDIAFYDRDGSVVKRLRMTPCAGTDAECPRYQAGGPFRFALETLVTGEGLPRGSLTGPSPG